MTDAPDGATGYAVELIVEAGPLAQPVAGRVVSVLAAHSNLPVDRLFEALSAIDALVSHAPGMIDDSHLHLAVDGSAGGLTVRLERLVRGGGRQLIEAAALPDVGSVIERLADEVSVTAVDGTDEEALSLRFS